MTGKEMKKTKSNGNEKEMKKQEISGESSRAQRSRRKSPGQRVVGNKIYDSENGKTCHQCRQKTIMFSASCKNVVQTKQCTINYCQRCLLNRYGEEAETVAQSSDWVCPKCRGICNCSFCRKKRGEAPTGILIHKAKSFGLSSVSEMLSINKLVDMGAASSSLEPKAAKEDSQTNGDPEVPSESAETNGTAKRETRGAKAKRLSDGNVAENNDDQSLPRRMSPRKRKFSQEKDKSSTSDHGDLLDESKAKGKETEDCAEEVSLPQGTLLKNISGIDIPAEDIGLALQFLEFCEAFGQLLNLKKGQSELMLRELACGRRKRWIYSSPVIQFQVQLLSLIKKDGEKHHIGENSWLSTLYKCVSKSDSSFNELQADSGGDCGYGELALSTKLKLLNLLCDEVIENDIFRLFIEEEQAKGIKERKQKAKEAARSEKEKQNMERKQLQNKMAQAIIKSNGASVSVAEHAEIVSNIKLKVSEALENTKASSHMEPELDAGRSEPILCDGHGHVFWKLNSYASGVDILLQDTEEDRWYTFDDEQKAMVEKYIASFRNVSK